MIKISDRSNQDLLSSPAKRRDVATSHANCCTPLQNKAAKFTVIFGQKLQKQNASSFFSCLIIACTAYCELFDV